MIEAVGYTIVSIIIVSLVSFIGVFTLALKGKLLDSVLMLLVSLSAGTLFGGSFLHLLPETVQNLGGFDVQISLLVLAGVITFFLIEKFIHMHTTCDTPEDHHTPIVHKHHPHHLGIMNLVGDAVHNFSDGLIIAGSYLVSIPVGIAATIAVILHEIPQELADFGVLLYAGFTKKKALLLNFFSAGVALLGATIGLILGAKFEMFVIWILPFAAGGFIYIAGSNLIPELHKECDLKSSFWHFVALLVGIGMMAALLLIG